MSIKGLKIKVAIVPLTILAFILVTAIFLQINS
ncbi:MAG: hypothetical protein US19_C0050G0007, partial [Candidatus Daviesbacteria bacterium GW2011_GWB1_36_5]